jgi:hypothetical protein
MTRELVLVPMSPQEVIDVIAMRPAPELGR